MYKKFPFKLIEGKEEDNALRIWYKIPGNKKILVQRGVMRSDCIYIPGEQASCHRVNSITDIDKMQAIDYLFLDFIFVPEENECEKLWKIGKVPIDIRPQELDNVEINILFIDQRIDMIFGVGKADFLKQVIEIDLFEDYDIKILGFCD